jgi:hypothetical protein
MFKKGMIFLLICALALLASTACGGSAETATVVDSAAQVVTTDTATDNAARVETVANTAAASGQTSAAEALAKLDQTQGVAAVAEDTESVAIALNGDSISADGPGVTVGGSVATMTAAGTYSLSGTLADGQIVVDTEDEATVTLILNGVDISNSTSAPIYIQNAEAVVIVLADGSANNLTDAASYVFADSAEEEPSGTIFSNADLTIGGSGALTVTGNYNDAITSDDGLTIAGGAISVSAVDDGLRGKDYLVIQGGTITVNAGGDGLKSDNEDDATLGYIALSGGVINVTAGGDAIAAETDVLITGGEFTLTAGGGSGSVIAADASAKGIKGLTNVLIDGGSFTIDVVDDAIHSNANITINGGTFTIATGDDGIHADATVTINGGEIAITESYEGIESAVITINDGDINVVASDDGVNVAGGADGSGMMGGPGRGGRPGGDTVTYTGSYYLYIHGGTIVVTAAGDGLDANGAIEMTGGVVLVNGPTEQMNSALDYDGTFNISGGFFVAAGSAGMAQGPSQLSTQNSLLVNFSGSLPAGTLIHIQDSAGNEILTFAPSKEFQSIVFSSPDLATGTEYTLYYGGSSTGTATDGLYQGGSYTPGTEYTSFTVSSTVTQMGGGGGGGMRP